jgi:hypothetical protein
MRELTEFQRRAALVALRHMFNGRYFCICTIRECAKMLGISHACGGPDWSALELLHCVDWAEMGPELAAQVRETCMRILACEPVKVEFGDHTRKPERILVRLLP